MNTPTHLHHCADCAGFFYCGQPATRSHGCLLPDHCPKCDTAPRSPGWGDVVYGNDIHWVTA